MASKTVAAPKIRQTNMLIGGKWQESRSGKRFSTINPVDEKVLAEVPEGNEADVDAAVKAARTAFESGPWHRMDARDRGRLMNKLADLIEANLDELAALETLDNGKPISDAKAADLPLAIDCLRYYAGWADKLTGDTIPIRGNYFCYTRREPIGVAGQIIPWNFPILMAAWKWGPALASGCTIVMKPAEQTLLTCLRLAELAQEAGIPDGVINIVTGHGETGAAIVRHPGVDKIAFTGHYETAQKIMVDASKTLKRLTFELGGKSPNVVFAGRGSGSGRRGRRIWPVLQPGSMAVVPARDLFVEQPVYDQFVDKVVARAKSRKLGDPLDPDTTQGPQVDSDQFQKIMSYIDKGKTEGAQCLTGGSRFGDKGYFIEPTIFFSNVKDNMSIALG